MQLSDHLVLVRGGGQLGSGVALRLHRAGFTVLVTELAQPRCLRRGAALAEAVYAGSTTVEGELARLADDPMAGLAYAVVNAIPVVVEGADDTVTRMQPRIVVDARRPLPALQPHLPGNYLLIGLGAGFTAGVDCHAVVETAAGPHLGRVYWEGQVEGGADAPEPGVTVLRTMEPGLFEPHTDLGAELAAGATVGAVAGQPIFTLTGGRVCGLLAAGLAVEAGAAVAELDADNEPLIGFLISDRARAVGGAVLEAALTGLPHWLPPADPDAGRP